VCFPELLPTNDCLVVLRTDICTVLNLKVEMRSEKKRLKGGIVRGTKIIIIVVIIIIIIIIIIRGQSTNFIALKVSRQCPIVLLVEVGW
jgi:hypothetical protein